MGSDSRKDIAICQQPKEYLNGKQVSQTLRTMLIVSTITSSAFSICIRNNQACGSLTTSTLGLSLCAQRTLTSVVAIVAIAVTTSHNGSHTQLRERRSSDETLYPALYLLCIRTHNIPPNRKHGIAMNKRLRFALFTVPIKMRLRNHTVWFLEQCLHKLDIDRYSNEQPIRLRDFLSDYEMFTFEEDDYDY